MNTGSGYKGTPSGSYTLALSFYNSNDCTGNLLYFCAEQVNVFDNLTTDTWINSGSSYMKTDSLGKTVLKIYEELVKSSLRKDFYVDGASGDGIDGNGEYFKPFKSVSKASKSIISILCGEVVDCQKPA